MFSSVIVGADDDVMFLVGIVVVGVVGVMGVGLLVLSPWFLWDV